MARDRLTCRSPDGRCPQRFVGLAVSTLIVAVGSVVAYAFAVGWHIPAPARFWTLAAFVLAGELLPIPVPRRGGLDKVTISSAFAFALVLVAGLVPAGGRAAPAAG